MSTPRSRFVLIGDSGEKDPEIYAAVARTDPGRILAIYTCEVRRDPSDGRVEEVSDAWTEDVPLVLPATTDA
ncbi:MAG: phosphatase domain-containing protein [Nocardioidaceae bacterium]